MTTYISQGSAATDLRRDDSFNTNFLHRSLMNLTVKIIKIGPCLSKLQCIKIGRELLTPFTTPPSLLSSTTIVKRFPVENFCITSPLGGLLFSRTRCIMWCC